MPDELDDLIRRMVEAGEPESNIKAVIEDHDRTVAAKAAPKEPKLPFTQPVPLQHRDYMRGREAVAQGDNPAELLPDVAAGVASAATGGAAAVPAAAGRAAVLRWLGKEGVKRTGAAAAGGMGARAALQAAEGENPISADVAFEGVKQGAMEALPMGLGAALRPVGKAMYRVALRPSLAIRKGFGDVSEIGIREGVPVTQKGTLTAGDLTTASRKAALGKVADAEAAGVEGVAAKEVTGELGDAFTKARNQAALGGGDPNALAKLKTRVQTIARTFGGTPAVPATPDKITRVPLRQRGAPSVPTGDEAVTRAEYELGPQAELAPSRLFQPTEPEVRAARQLGGSTAGTIPRRVLNGPAQPPREFTEFVTPGTPGTPAVQGRMKPTRAQELKEEAQDLAANAYQTQSRGGAINVVDPVADLGIAGGFQKALEKRVPGLDVQNKRTQELLGLLKALEDADAARLAGGPQGLTSMLNQIPTSPRAWSSMGIALDRTGKAAGGRVPPQMLRLLGSLARGETIDQLEDEQP